jgi:hypothetical protein
MPVRCSNHFPFKQMPRNKISNIVEGHILELLHQGYSQPRIVNILKLDEISVSQLTVFNVKRNIGRKRNSEFKIKIFRKRITTSDYRKESNSKN